MRASGIVCEIGRRRLRRHRLGLLVLTGHVVFGALPATAAIPAAQRQVLLDLYNGTSGPSWTNSSGWNGTPGTECTWFGITCDALGNNVLGIRLPSNHLWGTMPVSLSTLTTLRDLDLSYNLLSGGIPSLSRLTNLGTFDLSWNNTLTGSIPSLAGLVNLRRFEVDANQLTGTVPPLSGLSSLEDFGAGLNQLTGPIPPLAGLARLQKLYLSYNQLTGPFPSLSGLGNLQQLFVASNQLSGAIPSLSGASSLRTLYAGGNRLSGPLPDVSGLPLEVLALAGNRLTGEIPSSYGGLASLRGLDLRWNALFSTNPSLVSFLNSRQTGGDWQSTQTIAPVNLAATPVSAHSVTVAWSPIAYTADTGNLRVYLATTPGGPWTPVATTVSKAATSVTVINLTSSTTYSFIVQTTTFAHANNQNDVVSDFSPPVSARTLDVALPTATLGGTQSICAGTAATLTVALTGTPPWSLVWSDGYGQTSIFSSPATRSVTPAATTTYTIATVQNPTGTNTGTGSATVTVNPVPSAPVIAAPATATSGATGLVASVPGSPGSTYLWAITGGTITSSSTASSITFSAGSPGTLTLTVAETRNGCTGPPGTANVIVTPAGAHPTATLSGTQSICAGTSTTLTVTLTGKPPWSLTWSDGSTQTGIVSSPVTRDVSPATTTVYGITTVQDADGSAPGTGSATVTVVEAPPAPAITAPVTVTAGTTGLVASVLGRPGSAYRWTIDGGTLTSSSTLSSITFTAGPPGILTLTVVETRNGCTSPVATATVTVTGGCPTPGAPVVSTATSEITGGQSLLLRWTTPANLSPGGSYVLETSRRGDFAAVENRIATEANSAVLSTERQDAYYDLFARVRAVSPCGSVGPDSTALHIVVGVAQTSFAFTRSSPAWTVTVGTPAPSAAVEVKNVGGTAGTIIFSPTERFFDVAPKSLVLGAGATGSVTVTVLAGLTQAPGVFKGSLVGAWGNQTVSTPVTLTVTDKPTPPGSRAGSEVKASATAVFFLAPRGENPAPQTLTLTVPKVVGTGPLYLAPSIGPGGSWLVLSDELSQPLPSSGQVTLSLSIDRGRRATTDGDSPLRTLLTVSPVGGAPEDATVVEVVDQESWDVEPGAGGRGSQPGSAQGGFLVPATVKASGVNGAAFYSDGWLRNLGAGETALELYFTPRNQNGLSGEGVLRAESSIGPGRTLRLSDLLGSVFRSSGSGQVELRSPGAAGLTLRTTVSAVTGGDPALSFGTEIPATASGTGLGASDGAHLVLPGISDDAVNRCNLILAETSGASVAARVELYTATGQALGSTSAEVPPYGQVQIDRVVQAIAPGRSVTGGWLAVTASSGTGRLVAVATVLDNRSNSFSAVSGSPVALQAQGRSGEASTAPLSYVVPTLVRASGANNTQYTTTLSIVNGVARPAQLSLTYHYTDLSDGGAKVVTRSLRLEGRSALDPALGKDVLASVLGVTAPSRGWLEIEGDLASVTAVATISTLVDPADPAKGVNSAQVNGFLAPSATLLRLGAQEKRFAGMEKSVLKRTNLILVETSGQEATVRLKAYSLTGQLLAERTVNVPPLAYYQINDVFGPDGLGLGDGPFQNVEIAGQVTNGPGQVVGVVTLVGNISKNPEVYLMKDPGPPPTIGF